MSLEDDRVLFYLRHRDQIEEWAALRFEAAQAVDEWLVALRPGVEELVAELGSDVIVHAVEDLSPPVPELPHCPPRLARCVDRGCGRVDLAGVDTRQDHAPRERERPYVGLRSAKERALGGLLRDSRSERYGLAGRTRRARGGSGTATWCPRARSPRTRKRIVTGCSARSAPRGQTMRRSSTQRPRR